jgi:aspartyl/glutamyl-tRNA(Asn/Gln) amidotransferase C subunit
MHQRLRPDIITRQNDRENLMAAAPAQDQGYFLVPKVID